MLDYFTCLGAFTWAQEWSPPNATIASSLICGAHNCSCATPKLPLRCSGLQCDDSEAFASMTSTIFLNGSLLQLPAPPLTISLAISRPDRAFPLHFNANYQNASAFFLNHTSVRMERGLTPTNGSTDLQPNLYLRNNALFNETYIKDSGRCVAEDAAYSWGFSSLLLLTFCIYTILFASTLILLQTDVYWNSRADHNHQSHSLYTDLLYLAEELKSAYGSALKDELNSPKALSRKVDEGKQGSRLEVSELPHSRGQMWRFYHGFVSLPMDEMERATAPSPPLDDS